MPLFFKCASCGFIAYSFFYFTKQSDGSFKCSLESLCLRRRFERSAA